MYNQYDYEDDSELYHFGIKGMKWGVRKDVKRSIRAAAIGAGIGAATQGVVYGINSHGRFNPLKNLAAAGYGGLIGYALTAQPNKQNVRISERKHNVDVINVNSNDVKRFRDEAKKRGYEVKVERKRLKRKLNSRERNEIKKLNKEMRALSDDDELKDLIRLERDDIRKYGISRR